MARDVLRSRAGGLLELVAVEHRVLHSTPISISLIQVKDVSAPALQRISPYASLHVRLFGKLFTRILDAQMNEVERKKRFLSWRRVGQTEAQWSPDGAWELVLCFGREARRGFIGTPVEGQASFYDEIRTDWKRVDRTIHETTA